jgi:hypothetical protein
LTANPRITAGFLAAGGMNIGGVLIFSLGLTNSYLSELYPAVFSTFGLICIALWGAAYIAVSKSYAAVPALVAVFAVEKAIYTASWFLWLAQHGGELPAIFARSPVTGVFYVIYGPNDLLFGVFFAVVAWRTWKSPESAR